jgi:hypothetical protein
LHDFAGSRAEYDGIEIDRNGNLVVGVQVDGPVPGSTGPNGGVIRMDPGTGGQMLVTFGGPSLFGILEGADGVAIVPEPSAGFLHIAALASLIAIRKWGSRGKR